MSKPTQMDDWLEEFESLVPRVKQWFGEATQKFAMPSDAGCRAVAFYMMALRQNVDDEQPDSRQQAIKYGRRFLRHIDPERRRIERMISAALCGTRFGDWLPQYQEIVWRIDEIQRHMGALLPALSPKLDAKPDPIRKLASVAREAWAETNGGDWPLSNNPDDPLCRFLVKALAAIGQERSPSAISAVLRGARRTGKGVQS